MQGASAYNPASFMALTPGTRLGPYEISAQIGVGGISNQKLVYCLASAGRYAGQKVHLLDLRPL